MNKLSPNKITLFGLCLSVSLFISWFLIDNLIVRHTIVALFLIAFLCDHIDGYIARKYDKCSVFGAFFDPAADFISFFCLLVIVTDAGFLPLWLVGLIAIRNILMSLLDEIALYDQAVIATSVLGKLKADLLNMPLVALYFAGVLAPAYQGPFLGLFTILLVIGIVYNIVIDHSVKKEMFYCLSIIFTLIFIFIIMKPSPFIFEWYKNAYIILTCFLNIVSLIFYYAKYQSLIKNNF